MVDARQPAAEGAPIVDEPADADPAEPGAMIAALAPDQPRPRPLPLRAMNSERDFQRRINRFGTTVRKEYPVEPVGHQGGEALPQLERKRSTALKRVRMRVW